ncbi:MAG TPA: FeoB-associated Cys-rich membrane protein [Candidatus Mailhella excrementigallinarum]|nr:MAG: FeoB-associated Cys-rich membrane protein [Desulfovibrionaceae bacterium]HIV66396.1 FeoB-associated Cys-rich membrane protein [Candidatus Mailhella excrementigallinarum]
MQGFVVGVIVFLALLYFVRRVRQTTRPGGGCGCGCSGCSHAPKDGSVSCPSSRNA